MLLTHFHLVDSSIFPLLIAQNFSQAYLIALRCIVYLELAGLISDAREDLCHN